MSHFFFKDSLANVSVTWDKLIDDLKATNAYNRYCYSKDYYSIFRQIITSMLLEEETILLDTDFTSSELKTLTGNTEFDSFSKKIPSQVFQDLNKNSLLEKIKHTGKNWKITLYTSGTTDTPKSLTHSFESIARFVKHNDKNKECIWGLAFNPTHMAGVQVFLQALLNGNTIIRLFGLSPQGILGQISENGITHLSATPTFYKLLLPRTDSFQSVKRMTSGGEKFSEDTMKELRTVFPNAKITNVYASTEAGTLFASENDVFTIKPEFEKLIKTQENELLLHKSLIGDFGPSSNVSSGDWFNTGDLIERVSEKPLTFRFRSRSTDLINVGGYNVNPLEVEQVICAIPGVQNARVYPKSNSVLGNIVCCDVVKNDEEIKETTIRTYLQSKLQEHKIPRFIKFVNDLQTTRTGKLKRS